MYCLKFALELITNLSTVVERKRRDNFVLFIGSGKHWDQPKIFRLSQLGLIELAETSRYSLLFVGLTTNLSGKRSCTVSVGAYVVVFYSVLSCATSLRCPVPYLLEREKNGKNIKYFYFLFH